MKYVNSYNKRVKTIKDKSGQLIMNSFLKNYMFFCYTIFKNTNQI